MDDVRAGRAAGFTGLSKWLVGPECRDVVKRGAEKARAAYQSRVTRRTGSLAKSAQVSVEVGGPKKDRWVSKVTVGDSKATYAASHEFGHAVESKLRGVSNKPGAHDLEAVLRSLKGV